MFQREQDIWTRSLNVSNIDTSVGGGGTDDWGAYTSLLPTPTV